MTISRPRHAADVLIVADETIEAALSLPHSSKLKQAIACGAILVTANSFLRAAADYHPGVEDFLEVRGILYDWSV